MVQVEAVVVDVDDPGWREAVQWAGAFVAGFQSDKTRRSYRRDLQCWFAFCAVHGLHPFRGLRRTHVELYLRQLPGLPRHAPAHGQRRSRTGRLTPWQQHGDPPGRPTASDPLTTRKHEIAGATERMRVVYTRQPVPGGDGQPSRELSPDRLLCAGRGEPHRIGDVRDISRPAETRRVDRTEVRMTDRPLAASGPATPRDAQQGARRRPLAGRRQRSGGRGRRQRRRLLR